jgi:hypothetical protein
MVSIGYLNRIEKIRVNVFGKVLHSLFDSKYVPIDKAKRDAIRSPSPSSGSSGGSGKKNVQSDGLHSGTESHRRYTSDAQFLDPCAAIELTHGCFHLGTPAILLNERLAGLMRSAFCQAVAFFAVTQLSLLLSRLYRASLDGVIFHVMVENIA